MEEQRTDKEIIHRDAVQVHGFGVRDKKGREFGATVRTGLVQYTPFTIDPQRPWHVGYARKPGTYFYFEPHATRNGDHYGASQNAHEFDTEQERSEAIAAYLAGAKKRALKNKAAVA